MFGKITYRLRKGFERYFADDFQWGQLTAQQRLRMVDLFKKATMNDKEEFVEEYASQCYQLKIVRLIKVLLAY